MSARHLAALHADNGACNMLPIATALAAAIAECRAEGVNELTDPAVRLITHQLAFLCNASHRTIGDYEKLVAECERLAGTTLRTKEASS